MDQVVERIFLGKEIFQQRAAAGQAGAAGAVVTVTADEAAALISAGQADDNPAAVEYRKSVNAKAD